MDIVGIGAEIIECLRIGRLIEKHGEQFLSRIYTAREIRFCQARKRRLEHFAGHWAAKEAVLKSLGTRWKPGLAWTDVEVRHDAAGMPRVILRGAIRDLAEQRGIGDVLLSMASCRAYATAYATALRG
jgi:holo-[acyl-carrier protein] synthase